MMSVACIGEAMIELSLVGNNAQLGVAGDTLNTAIYLHRAAPNIQVDFITCLGDDPFSGRICDFMAVQGIGASAVRKITGASPGLYAIATTPEGERSFTYWRSNAAARQLFADHDFSLLERYDAVYLSGISLAILPHDIRLALIDYLKASSLRVIYDSNYRPRLWDSIDSARRVTAAMWARADIALPSIDDEMLLFDETADQVTARFAKHKGQGALKRGPKGPLSIGQAVPQSYRHAPSVIDTTAAGDSFNGGYLAALLTGKTQSEALSEGHALAAVVIQHRGAIIPE
ncbi:MAG: sugar kinase [Ascidiaceihabitans sp.]|nr:sugar kinase [Ascidiaceihabitans sp.]